MNNPYDVLGVSPNAPDAQIKEAYRALARKYHPDNYTDNPLSDLAKDKMTEINAAYDEIMEMRRSSSNPSGDGTPNSNTTFPDIRNKIMNGQIDDAETLLDGIPAASRNAEWYYLKGTVQYRRGWLENAHQNFSAACNMDPGNAEYRAAFNQMNKNRAGGYRTQNAGCMGCSPCDCCAAFACADCCCDCC